MSKKSVRQGLALVALLLAAGACAAGDLPHYTVVPLAMPDAMYEARPSALNRAGTVVGCVFDFNSDCHAVVWQADGTPELLPVDGNSNARDINDKGDIVGTIYSNRGWGFVIHKGELHPVEKLAPVAINEAGSVIGEYYYSKGLVRAWIHERGQGAKRLLDVPGDVTGFNNLGHAVGQYFVRVGKAWWWGPGYLWRDGEMISLEGFYPAAINDSDEIAGYDDQDEGALWKDGVLTPIAATAGWDTLRPVAINNAHVVVGNVHTPHYGNAGFYLRDGEPHLLNDLLDPGFAGWEIDDVVDVNEDGVILATGYEPGGGSFAVKLVPSPAR